MHLYTVHGIITSTVNYIIQNALESFVNCSLSASWNIAHTIVISDRQATPCDVIKRGLPAGHDGQ